ncbi:hypothetical protein ACWD11_11870 [Streptomyces sp. NPDC002776]
MSRRHPAPGGCAPDLPVHGVTVRSGHPLDRLGGPLCRASRCMRPLTDVGAVPAVTLARPPPAARRPPPAARRPPPEPTPTHPGAQSAPPLRLARPR